MCLPALICFPVYMEAVCIVGEKFFIGAIMVNLKFLGKSEKNPFVFIEACPWEQGRIFAKNLNISCLCNVKYL